ncbi:hypothetical protein OH492_11480 [Vibrio chagasii]|nr:hypothetical protein [Vibrio chagasii]
MAARGRKGLPNQLLKPVMVKMVKALKGADRSCFPPLSGRKRGLNWGAGMHRVNTAAYFIYENMPLGRASNFFDSRCMGCGYVVR